MLDGDRPVALQVHGNFGPSEPGDVGVLAIRGGNGEEGCKDDGVLHFFGGGSVKFCREQEGRLRFVELCLCWPEVLSPSSPSSLFEDPDPDPDRRNADGHGRTESGPPEAVVDSAEHAEGHP